MSSRRILNILRSLFFVTSLACAGIAFFWPQIYPELNKADWTFVKLHTREHQVKLDDAKKLLKGGDREGGLAKLANLAEGLEGVRRGDRLSPLRTKALDMLGDLHQKAGQLQESLKWSEELLTYDPRDFTAMMRRSELLKAMGDEEGGFEQLAAAYEVGSVSGLAQLRYIDALCERGEREELAETLLELGERGPLGVALTGWEFRWSDDATLNFKPRVTLPLEKNKDVSGQFHADLKREQGSLTARSLRIDLPGGSLMAMSAVNITVHRADGSSVEFTDADMGHINHIVKEEGHWLPTGNIDPYFVIKPKDIEPLTDVVGFHVVLNLRPYLPAPALELLRLPFAPDLRARWIERFGTETVAALETFHD